MFKLKKQQNTENMRTGSLFQIDSVDILIKMKYGKYTKCLCENFYVIYMQNKNGIVGAKKDIHREIYDFYRNFLVFEVMNTTN